MRVIQHKNVTVAETFTAVCWCELEISHRCCFCKEAHTSKLQSSLHHPCANTCQYEKNMNN